MRCCDKLLSYVLEAIYCIFLNFDTQLIHNYELCLPPLPQYQNRTGRKLQPF